MNLPHSLFDRPSKSPSLGTSTMRMTNIPVTARAVSSVCLDAAGGDNTRIKRGGNITSHPYMHIHISACIHPHIRVWLEHFHPPFYIFLVADFILFLTTLKHVQLGCFTFTGTPQNASNVQKINRCAYMNQR